jgi:broad specificity phosphatase PhoE
MAMICHTRLSCSCPVAVHKLQVPMHISTGSFSACYPYNNNNNNNKHTRLYSSSSRREEENPSSSRCPPPLPVNCTRHLTVTLLRHGQSTWNQQNIIQGSSDESELTGKGKEQAKSAAALLQRLGWDQDVTETWASPLKRARQTAEIVHQCLNRRTDLIHYLYSLREIDLYSFQGMKKKSAQAKASAAYAAWQKHPATCEIDGHAPVKELWYRASTVWNTLFADATEDNILIVAHNATNQALIHTALGLDPSMFRRIIQSNASLSRLEFLPQQQQILVHAINRVPMKSMIEKEVAQKNRRHIVLVCGGDGDGHAVVEDEAWTVVDGRGRDEDWIQDRILQQSTRIVMLNDEDGVNRMIKRLLGISREDVRFVSDPGSVTLLTCPWTDNDCSLVCSNYPDFFT